MRPRIPNRLQQRASGWNHLSNRQRSDLGKELRRLGLMQSEIREIIPVAKSTLSYWCRDVQSTQKQIDKIRQRRYSTAGGRRDTQAKRREEIRILRTEAQQQAAEWSCDPLFAAGVALYWAEGSKTRNHFSMANTDPALLRMFIGWVRQYLEPLQIPGFASTSTRTTANRPLRRTGERSWASQQHGNQDICQTAGNRTQEESHTRGCVSGSGMPGRRPLATNNAMD